MKIEKVTSAAWRCPHCGTLYKTEQEAADCVKAREWADAFSAPSLVWKWNICLAGPDADNRLEALIPGNILPPPPKAHINPGPCRRESAVLYDCASGRYTSVSPVDREGCWKLVETLSITEGYEKYGFVPSAIKSMNWRIPEAVQTEIRDIQAKAFDERLSELKSSGLGLSDICRWLLGEIHPEFVGIATLSVPTRLVMGREELSNLPKERFLYPDNA